MAAITPGTNATIQSNKLEFHLLETLLTLQIYEANPDFNPSKKDCIQGSYNINTGFFDVTFKISGSFYLNAQGEAVTQIPNYLPGIAFTPGSPTGTFKSTTLPAYFVEVLMYCERLENNVASNTSEQSRVVISHDIEAKEISGTIKLPCTLHADTYRGRGLFSPIEYLV